MDDLNELITWATEKGVKLNGIKPTRMPGRGVGIVATRQITPGEVILEVPTACLRTTDTVSKALARRLPRGLTVHGLLAADLALDLKDEQSASARRHAPWNAACPTPEDLGTMPLLWPAALQALLPRAARELLSKQQAKLAKDWADVCKAFPDEGDEDRYRYAWLLVNTRTFYYYVSPGGNGNGSSSGGGGGGGGGGGRPKRRKTVQPTDPDSCMCLQPVADLFNHDDGEGCSVAFDEAGYAVRAARAYAAGEEVRISYGRHAGDFLLAEYGFALSANRFDEVALDDAVLPRLSRRQRDALDEVGFLGRYVTDRETAACHRTQVALRLLCCRPGEWRCFVEGVDDGAASQREVDALLVEILCEYRRMANKTIRQVERLKSLGKPEQRAVLAQRWKQIRDMLTANINKLEEGDGDAE